MKKIVLFAVVLAFASLLHVRHDAVPLDGFETEGAIPSRSATSEISGIGTVIRILPDDDRGERHQRFLLRLQSGTTLLVAHNIDIAPRVEPLREGDTVEYRGEFAWNPKGGVVHWTHHDPAGRHPGGWLRHDGRTFQ